MPGPAGPVRRVPGERAGFLVGGQFLRFVVTGVVSTAIFSAIYLAMADWILPRGWAVAAVLPAYFASLAFGYTVNSRWSFRDRPRSTGQRMEAVRYVLSQNVGLVLNLALTWIVTALLRLPNWSALIPMVILTPLVTFALSRRWVFA